MKSIEALGIGYVCGGRFLAEIKALIETMPPKNLQRNFGCTDENIWEFFEFGDRRGIWNRFRWAIFWRPFLEEKQFLLPGSRPGTLADTNLGMGFAVDEQLEKTGLSGMVQAEGVIATDHGRGADELVHRSLKDFGFEALPFLRFAPNAAFYYCMLVAFFLFEAFKEDVTTPIVLVTPLPVTLRGKLVDVAGRTILKLTDVVMEILHFKELWERCLNASKFAWS
jgi:hypothetical protein